LRTAVLLELLLIIGYYYYRIMRRRRRRRRRRSEGRATRMCRVNPYRDSGREVRQGGGS